MVAIQPLLAPVPEISARPHLRLIQGGRSAPSGRRQRTLHRRRRLAALVLLVVLVVGSAVGVVAGLRVRAGGPGSGSLTATGAASSVGRPAALVPPHVAPGERSHVVREGETLWGIAREIAPPGGDVAVIVNRLVARNSGVSSVRPGMRLLLD